VILLSDAGFGRQLDCRPLQCNCGGNYAV